MIAGSGQLVAKEFRCPDIVGGSKGPLLIGPDKALPIINSGGCVQIWYMNG
jgi:hypothetical protein